MSNFDLRRTLRGLGRMAVNDNIDRAIQRSCIGRIVSALTGIFMLACLLIVILLSFLANESGLMDMLPDFIGNILGAMFVIGFIAAIIIAGIIGGLLRRQLWQLLRSRRR